MAIIDLPQVVVPNSSFRREVEELSGEKVSACFQCEKCTSGCPVTFAMDIVPHKTIRSVHLGLKDQVLRSDTIWVCASCQTCTTRCPNGIDIAGVMDTLRMMAIERRIGIPDTRGEKFNRSFLGSVRRHGRVYEMGMMAAYKLRTRDFFSDVDKAPKMLLKKKLSLLPNRSGAAGEVKKVFKRAEEEEKRR